MKERVAHLPPQAFEACFPFHLQVDGEMKVLSWGKSLEKLIPDLKVGQPWTEFFAPIRPALRSGTIRQWVGSARHMVLAKVKDPDTRMRGQLVELAEWDSLIFAWSPWVTNIRQVTDLGLTLRDFAAHDPISDLLFLLKTRDVSIQETQKLNNKLTEQSEELRTAVLAAESANRAKTNFLTSVSHELRTPMNGVLGFCNILGDTKLENEQLKLVNAIRHSSQAMTALIDNILDIIGIDDGQFHISKSPMNTRDALRDVCEMTRLSAAAKNLRFEIDIDPHLPELALGDSKRLRQILIALLDNSVKFTDNGRISLHASFETTPDQSYVVYRISDTGIGIPEHLQDKIFEAFEQADGGMTRTHGGLGIGLSIVRQFVDRLQGTIVLQSVVSVGTCVVVRLPHIPVPISSKTSSPIESDSDSQVGWKILVVEDNPVNQRVATRFLEKAGCEVSLAMNGQEALELVKSEEFDLVLMDCQMPVMDGLTATRRIREFEESRGDCSRIPIVALTANAMPGDREKCLHAGMDDYLSKPVQYAEIKRVLRKWLGRRRAAAGSR